MFRKKAMAARIAVLPLQTANLSGRGYPPSPFPHLLVRRKHMSQELAAAIEKMYRCRVIRLKPKRTVWLCDTNLGSWVVKGYPDFQKAAWVTHLSMFLPFRRYRFLNGMGNI
jgi:hypothetical protein